MKIILLHYSFWPQPGGVEQVMRDQASLLHRAGYEVAVLSGIGSDPGGGYEVIVVPELAADHELNIAVRSVLDRGQADQNFNKYRSILVETLGRYFAEAEIVLVHNVFTMNTNLPLTMALHDLAKQHRLVAWTHDLAATNTDIALPNPQQPPWNLMRLAAPGVNYVAVSAARAQEIGQVIKPSLPVRHIPNPLDLARVFGLTPEMCESLSSISLAERDFVFLLPAKLLVRKNIEFAIQVIVRLCDLGYNPLLLVTGDMGEGAAAVRYGEFIRQSIPEKTIAHIVFVSQFFPVQDDTLRDLFLVVDCLLFPSKQEGFGMPVIEASLYRLPIWCSDVPAYRALEGTGAFLLTKIEQVEAAVAWLEALPTFVGQRKTRQLFDPLQLTINHYEPLFQALILAKK